jgi:ABC-2 type transport system permease protein
MSQILTTTKKSLDSGSLDISGRNELADFWQETSAMTKRLFIQLRRRPSSLIAGVIQPFMWLLLFGALFAKVPSGLFGEELNYAQFLAPGIIVFTAFSAALNAGLPVMFDREFGFLNRLLVAPLSSRYSIVLSSTLYIVTLSLIQTSVIVATSAIFGSGLPSLSGLALIISTVFLIVLGVTALSLGLSFALPGHIELIAVIFVTNLPLLFASTALAPLNFMADWLEILVLFNPLTYAIEAIRYVYSHENWNLTSSLVLETDWLNFNFLEIIAVLVAFDFLALILIQPLLKRRFA